MAFLVPTKLCYVIITVNIASIFLLPFLIFLCTCLHCINVLIIKYDDMTKSIKCVLGCWVACVRKELRAYPQIKRKLKFVTKIECLNAIRTRHTHTRAEKEEERDQIRCTVKSLFLDGRVVVFIVHT